MTDPEPAKYVGFQIAITSEFEVTKVACVRHKKPLLASEVGSWGSQVKTSVFSVVDTCSRGIPKHNYLSLL
jgi:hypothetical protein